MRLFCLPSAGYGAAMYHGWGAELPGEIEVCALTLPGRETLLSQPPVGDLMELVERIVDNTLAEFDRPFSLFGHSMGAWLAYELAHALSRRAIPAPVSLIVSGRRAPSFRIESAPMHILDDGDLITEIQKRYGPISRAVLDEPAIVSLLLPALRADLRCLETYQFDTRPKLSCPVYVLGGDSDHAVPPDHLESWRSIVSGDFYVHRFAGDHFFLQKESRRDVLNLVARSMLDDIGHIVPHS
jgi:surfactin synthase thioesterase subunit